jgi:hypothetical protein
LRYHLAPDLRLTSRGASLAAKRHFYSPSKWPGFPCISRSSFTYFKGRRKFGPCGKSSAVPVLDLPRPRGLSKPYLVYALPVQSYGGNGDHVSLQRSTTS